MSLDEDLLELVEDFVTLDAADIMEAVFTPTSGAIRDIMFTWAGVDGVSPTSRGSYIDARVVEFLEEFMGRNYVWFSSPNPGANAAPVLMDAWNIVYNAFAIRIAYQALGAAELFEDGSPYDPVSDTIDGTSVDLDAVEDWLSAAVGVNDTLAAARFILETIDSAVGISNLSSPDRAALEAAMPWGVTIDAFQNILTGSGSITGSSNDDFTFGSASTDTIYGNGGNDALVGGAGSDTLNGGGGDDTYIFAAGSGSDVISADSSGTDTIHLAGYAPADVRVWTEAYGYLSFASKATPGDTAYFYVGTTGASGTTHELDVPMIEEIAFDNGTTWNLTSGLLLEGTSSSQSLYGTQYNDQIDGSGGTDTLYGNRGNDTLIGGSGTDTLNGGAGDDTYVFASGSGSDYISADASGTDVIRFTGYATTDIRMWTESYGYLYLASKATPTDSVYVYVGTTGAGGTTHELDVPMIEQVLFDDTTTWNLTSGLNIEGSSGGESLYGSQYNDQISGLCGADTLWGNRGNDTLIGGGGDDQLNGGAGNDTYVFASGPGSDFINVESGGTDTIRPTGYATTDVRMWTEAYGYLYVGSKATPTDNIYFYAGTTGASGTTHEIDVPIIEQVLFDDTTTWSLTSGLTIEGSSSNETLYGSQYNDQLKGVDGNDTLYGNRGNDTLIGGNGTDTLYGGDGTDILYGSAGADTMTGGAGADTFMFELASAFSNQDSIADFSTANGDKIDLHDVLEVEFDPLTETIAQFVDFTNSGGDSIMSVDRDGTGTTYSFANVATISGVTNLDETTLYNNGNLLAA